MKIAFVYDAVYPWIKGGAEKRIFEMGKLLAEKENDVHLFGIKWWDGDNIIEYEGMTLHGVCGKQDLYINGKRSIREALIFSVKLFLPLNKEKFDIIDVSVFPYFSCFTVKVISLLRRTTAVLTWHEFWGDYWYEYMGKKGFFGKNIEKLVYLISPNNIAVSEMTKNYLESLGYKRNGVKVVSNGINIGYIESIPPFNEEYDVLFAGRMIKEKHVDVLLKSIAELKDRIPYIRLCIIGDGPERDDLTALIEALDIADNITMTGFLEYDEVIARIKASKIFVLPSSREGFGIVVIEAFTCETPVITVKEERNASQYLVDETCGILTELNEGQITEAIEKLLNDDKIHLEMSENAARKSKDYDWDSIVIKYLQICEELM
jgi:glycosyltransferase involved in cell wall biosynthesis